MCRLRCSIQFFSLAVLLVLLVNSCSEMRSLIKELPLTYQNFLSEVRYIISREEKKDFVKLTTDRDRDEFIKKFWTKRDPDPSTSENEFKTMYFQRIEEANRLFREMSTPGWLTDRGRVLILLGPPETKRIYPTGYRIQDFPSEVWYYGYFPIVFIDKMYNSEYRLSPLSSYHVAEMNKHMDKFSPKVPRDQIPFDFAIDKKKDPQKGVILQLRFLYRNILLKEGKDGYYSTTLQIVVEAQEINQEKKQRFKTSHLIKLTQKDLESLKRFYVVEIPLPVKDGKYDVEVTVDSDMGEKEVSRRARIRI